MNVWFCEWNRDPVQGQHLARRMLETCQKQVRKLEERKECILFPSMSVALFLQQNDPSEH